MKKIRFGILFNDCKIMNKDLSDARKGNPGVGGTEYCYLMLIAHLQEQSSFELTVYTYSDNCNNKYPEGLRVHNCKTRNACVEEAVKDGTDVFLVNFTELPHIDEKIKELQINTIVWVHNLIEADTIHILNANPFYKRVILLGREHFERYWDNDIIKKCVIIPNMVSPQSERRNEKLQNVVTYTGALVKSKGFHVLAKNWKGIVKQVPDSQLYIIGSGALYDNSQKLGKYGIAEEHFENEFIRYLLDADGKILDSVHFMGLLGNEKNDIYKRTKVGVVNPTAKTEVCPISVLEMASFGIPVVSKGKNGVPDTVLDGCTGVLASSRKTLVNSIAGLLTDDARNREYGDNAVSFIQQKYTPEQITPLWINLIIEVQENAGVQSVKYEISKKYLNNDFKWLKMLIHYLRFSLNLRFLPSVVEIEYFFKRLIRRGRKI